MKRLTYDVREKHYCDYTTREIINRLAECEIMLEKIEKIVKSWNDMNSFDSMVQISEVVDNGDDNTVKAKLLYVLSKESTIVISTAYTYAKNYVEYGEDITKAWTTAVQHASIIEKVREKVWVEAYDSFKKECENCLKADMVAILDKLRAEIEQLPTNTRINWDGCCPDIDYPEIEYVDVTKNKLLSIIDKYKAESEG